MDLGLEGRRAFVSCTSSGIGKGISIELASEGCSVAVHGRAKARTEETVHVVEGFGVKAVVALGDLAHDADCDTVAAATLAGLRRHASAVFQPCANTISASRRLPIISSGLCLLPISKVLHDPK